MYLLSAARPNVGMPDVTATTNAAAIAKKSSKMGDDFSGPVRSGIPDN